MTATIQGGAGRVLGNSTRFDLDDAILLTLFFDADWHGRSPEYLFHDRFPVGTLGNVTFFIQSEPDIPAFLIHPEPATFPLESLNILLDQNGRDH